MAPTTDLPDESALPGDPDPEMSVCIDSDMTPEDCYPDYFE